MNWISLMTIPPFLHLLGVTQGQLRLISLYFLPIGFLGWFSPTFILQLDPNRSRRKTVVSSGVQVSWFLVSMLTSVASTQYLDILDTLTLLFPRTLLMMFASLWMLKFSYVFHLQWKMLDWEWGLIPNIQTEWPVSKSDTKSCNHSHCKPNQLMLIPPKTHHGRISITFFSQWNDPPTSNHCSQPTFFFLPPSIT